LDTPPKSNGISPSSPTPPKSARHGSSLLEATENLDQTPSNKRRCVHEESQTNFTRVSEFHAAFGEKNNTSAPRPNVFDQDPAMVKLRLDLIHEEVQELVEAVQNKDLDGTVDALTDILYVTYGAGAAFGVNLDAAFDIVHRSNMSKLCETEEVAKATVTKYEEQWAQGEGKYDSPAYRRAPDGCHWVVYNKSSGKVLKSMLWSPPDFTPIGVYPNSAPSGQ